MTDFNLMQFEELQNIVNFSEVEKVYVTDSVVENIKNDPNSVIFTVYNGDSKFSELLKHQIIDPRLCNIKKDFSYSKLYVDDRLYTFGVPDEESVPVTYSYKLYKPIRRNY